MNRGVFALVGLLTIGCGSPPPDAPDPPADDADVTAIIDAAEDRLPSDAASDRTDAERLPDGRVDVDVDAAPETAADGVADGEPVDNSAGPTCPGFGVGEDTGTVTNTLIDEASGVVTAADPPGGYWTHNDSGGLPQIFRLGPGGDDLGVVTILEASNHDWEDIARCPAASGDGWDLVIGDMGDNGKVRETITLYRFAEPLLDASDAVLTETLTLAYPDGAEDAEALLCDPVTDTLFIVTKGGFGDNTTRVFRVPKTGPMPRLLLPEGEIPLSSPATGGDWHPEGDLVVVRTYIHAEIFARHEGGFSPFEDGCAVPLIIEPQGEAITWSTDGAALVTVSEGDQPTLWRYPVQP